MHESSGEAAVEIPWREFLPGERVLGFTIEGKLGSGGFGVIYRATRDGRPFALKLVPMDARADREVDALRRVQDPNVVGFRGYGLWPDEAPRFVVLVLELVEGRPLDVWAGDENPSALELVRQVMLPLARTLGAVHAANVVHRDVKEANIVMREVDGQPVLVDFGAAGYEGAPRLTMRLPPGTREYRSPEAFRFAREWGGEPYPSSPADDLWALGVTLYFLLTRRLPFNDESGQGLVHAILHENPVPPHVLNPRVPPALSELCLRMLEKQPEARFADAQVLERAFEDGAARADDAWRAPLFPGGKRKKNPPVPSRARLAERRWQWVASFVLSAVVLRHDSPEVTPHEASSLQEPSSEVNSCQEIVCRDMTGEVEHGAGLTKSPTPAPVASATCTEEDTMLESKKSCAVVGTVCLLGSACAGGPQLRPPPPPEDCPPGAAEAMKRLDIHYSNRGATFPGYEQGTYYLSVQAGPITVTPYDGFQMGSLLSGKLLIGADRVYGRFTSLRLPSGEVLPVCMEMSPAYDSPMKRGVPLEKGSTPERPIIFTSVLIKAVPSFE